MKRCFILASIWIGAGAPVPLAQGQVHLVTGAQTTDTLLAFSSGIWRVGGDGHLHSVEEIASKEAGLFWVEVSYEKRVLVAVTREAIGKSGTGAIVVVDFDKASIVKRCAEPALPPNYMSIEEWLAKLPSEGLAFVQRQVSISGTGLNCQPPCSIRRWLVSPAT
jgi:hypothetical protein